MRRSNFRLLEGVLLSLPLLFASCGNGDNALEEIINGGGSGGSTPTVEEVIKYGFQLKSLAGVDLTGDATSLKMTKADGTLVAEAEVSAGKITIKNTDLTAASITAAADFWFEATVGTRKYVAKVNIDPAALSPETDKTLEMATLGDVILSDGKFYKAGTAGAVAMIAYLGNGSDCTNGLAIQLNDSPASMSWSDACNYSSYPSITGNPGNWRLPSKADWQNMFVGCAKSGDAISPDGDGNMSPIAGFNEKIGATGITWKSVSYWSSTGSGSLAWLVGVGLYAISAGAYFLEADSSVQWYVLGCLAF